MLRKWFNQSAEIKRLQGQIKHLQGELNVSNFDAQGWKKSALKTLAENEKLNNQISLSKIMIDERLKSARGWKKTALKALAENSKLKNGIQKALDCETAKPAPAATKILNILKAVMQ